MEKLDQARQAAEMEVSTLRGQLAKVRDELEAAMAEKGSATDTVQKELNELHLRLEKEEKTTADAVARADALTKEMDAILAREALEARDVMRRFALEGAPADFTDGDPEQDLARVEARIAAWDELIEAYGSTSFGPLAREEAEAWEILRVELYGRFRSADEAVVACNRLIERNRDSKLYAEHLIRLGDLHAAAARRESLVLRTRQDAFDVHSYDRSVGSALAAYELAAEARREGVRRQAQTRIATLLADHEGVRAHVR